LIIGDGGWHMSLIPASTVLQTVASVVETGRRR